MIVTDHHKSCLKTRARDKRIATESQVLMLDHLGETKINKKTNSEGGWQPPSPHLTHRRPLVRPRVKNIFVQPLRYLHKITITSLVYSLKNVSF